MDLNQEQVEPIIRAALAEDIGQGDITARLLVPDSVTAELSMINREPLVACGLIVAQWVFAAMDAGIDVTVEAKEGQTLTPGSKMLTAKGPARAILTAERTALNLVQRMSAVATLTARYVKEIVGTAAIILDTRKTIPGLRILDKYAVRMGGGRNHRMRLDDGILIKDNHIALSGGIAQALRRAQKGNTENLPLEIECDTLEQVAQALDHGAESILLDNMDLAQLRAAVELSAGRATLEASGNVNLQTVRAIAETGVNFISVGKLTHSAPNVDIGLDVALEP